MPPHNYNRNAFSSLDTPGPLLRTYCKLVVLELSLKDRAVAKTQPWPTGHDVPKLLLDTSDTAIENLAVQLQQRLGALNCTSKTGTRVTVAPAMFPGIRYLQHQNDFTGGSTDHDLLAVEDVLRDIEAELQRLDRGTL